MLIGASKEGQGGGGVLQMSEKLNRAGRILGSYGRQGGLYHHTKRLIWNLWTTDSANATMFYVQVDYFKS
jgi:hypothetical protein